ncbi:geraniol 8-hydroxylase-like [Tripterygium wilfordii]|uniref:Geraniol 8-hydroxylase-like n=3 Tax=Tripterygium wilfordii TaxID=458696 RepID=A0A7J7C734_TRIWF|nr:geraniol 8-hydroxylase-like [Tripterygium wilfordii]
MEFYAYLFFSLLLLICIRALLQLTKKKKLPPGPTGLPIIGNLLAIGDRPHHSLTKLAKTYGPLMTIRLGFNTTIVASSAEMAREILLKKDRAFSGRPVPDAITAEKNYHMSILWLQCGPKWRSLRKVCNTKIFSSQRLDAQKDLRCQMMDEMVKRVMVASEAGEAIGIRSLVFQTALSLLTKSMFSDDMIVDEKSNAVEELEVLIERIMELEATPNLSDHFPFLKPFDLQHIRRKMKVSYDRVHELIDQVIDQRLNRRASQLPRSNDLLDTLLDHCDEHAAEEFNHDDISLLLFVSSSPLHFRS